MLLVAIKFIEVFTRAAFVVGAIYTLSLADAGRFGIVVTMVTLFAFAFNGERHLDLQRRHVDSEAAVFDSGHSTRSCCSPFSRFSPLRSVS
jgi:hypothetical protein